MDRKIIKGVFVAFMGLMSLFVQAQSLTDYLAECERKYGSDADLVNGEKYYYPYARSEGNPFFYTEPQSSKIRISGKDFEQQSLRYDIFNQQVVLDYQDIYGSTSSLVLRNEWVESFGFANIQFRNMEGPEGESAYFQVILDSTITCIYKWSKKYQLNLNSGVQNFYFTEPAKESFLIIENTFYPYRNNRTFLKAFQGEQQKAIKSYIRQVKIKVNKSPDWKMQQLIEYCNSLPNEAT